MSKELSLYHLTRQPKVLKENPPLLIMLHGYGSNEADLFAFAPQLPADLLILSVRAPYDLSHGGYAWYEINWTGTGKFTNEEQAIASREIVKDFIEEAVEFYAADPTNVTLLGFSQGTIISHAVALSYPDKVKNVIGLSGYIDQNIILSGEDKRNFRKLSVYSSHGSADQVIPVQWARKTKPHLDQLQIENTYSEYPVGHGVAPDNFADLLDWLKRHL